MNKENILYYLGILENGALNYYQTVETIRIASQSIQNYIINLEQQVKEQKEVIDRIKEYIEPLITNKDDEECYPINFYVKDVLLSILKEVSE